MQRADREGVLVVPHAEGTLLGLELQFELAAFKGFAVAVAEEGDHELVVGAEPRPIDVEGMREG